MGLVGRLRSDGYEGLFRKSSSAIFQRNERRMPGDSRQLPFLLFGQALNGYEQPKDGHTHSDYFTSRIIATS